MTPEAPPPSDKAAAAPEALAVSSGAGASAAPPVQPPPPPELTPALEAFAAGDFRTAKRLVQALQTGSPNPEVAEAARALGRQLAPDPWAFWVGLAAIGVLAFVSSAYLF